MTRLYIMYTLTQLNQTKWHLFGILHKLLNLLIEIIRTIIHEFIRRDKFYFMIFFLIYKLVSIYWKCLFPFVKSDVFSLMRHKTVIKFTQVENRVAWRCNIIRCKHQLYFLRSKSTSRKYYTWIFIFYWHSTHRSFSLSSAI